MAVVDLLDSIVNDTIQNFRRNDALDDLLSSTNDKSLLLSPLSQSPSHATASGGQDSAGSGAENNGFSSKILDQIDSLMQEVEIGHYERIFWILLFSLMVLVAAGGNIIVIYIVSTNKEMKSVTNYFLVNLSLADTMVSTLNVIFNFISMLNSHWPFGKLYCKISNFIAILSISASVFTLTAISCDRYNAIIYPLRPRMSRRHAIAWILLIWTLSSALAMPNFIFSVVVEDRLVNENLALTCTMIWPDGRYPLSSYDHIYNIIILVITYLVPIFTMAILYYEVGKELWGYEAIGENIEKQRRAIMAKKKIVKMMIVVVIMFALCWLPYHGFFIVNYYLPTIFQDGPLLYQRCYLIIYWLAMSNSMYNPIIIYFMNSKFRHEFRRVLWLICCCRAYAPPIKCDSIANTTTYNINNNNNSNLNNQTNNNNTSNNNNSNNTISEPFTQNSRSQLASARGESEGNNSTIRQVTTNSNDNLCSRSSKNCNMKHNNHHDNSNNNYYYHNNQHNSIIKSSPNKMPIEVIITQSDDHCDQQPSSSPAVVQVTNYTDCSIDEYDEHQPFLNNINQSHHEQHDRNITNVNGIGDSIDLKSISSGDKLIDHRDANNKPKNNSDTNVDKVKTSPFVATTTKMSANKTGYCTEDSRNVWI